MKERRQELLRRYFDPNFNWALVWLGLAGVDDPKQYYAHPKRKTADYRLVDPGDVQKNDLKILADAVQWTISSTVEQFGLTKKMEEDLRKVEVKLGRFSTDGAEACAISSRLVIIQPLVWNEENADLEWRTYYYFLSVRHEFVHVLGLLTHGFENCLMLEEGFAHYWSTRSAVGCVCRDSSDEIVIEGIHKMPAYCNVGLTAMRLDVMHSKPGVIEEAFMSGSLSSIFTPIAKKVDPMKALRLSVLWAAEIWSSTLAPYEVEALEVRDIIVRAVDGTLKEDWKLSPDVLGRLSRIRLDVGAYCNAMKEVLG